MMVSLRNRDRTADLIYLDLTFHFNCFNAVDPDDRPIGLVGGQLHIRGSLLRDNVFDPVVNQVCFSYFRHPLPVLTFGQ